MVDGVSNTSASNTSPVTQKGTGIADDFNTFLKILVTQLQNQDPTSPLDPNQFTEQLVQFASVEQSIKQNTNLEKILGSLQGNGLIDSANLVGKFVEVEGDSIIVDSAQPDATKSFSYANSTSVSEVKIEIKNEVGNVLYSTTGNITPGKHTFTWDGKGENGQPLPDGFYTLEVSSKAAAASDYVTIPTNIIGEVESILQAGGEIYASFEGFNILIDEIVTVINPKQQQTTNNTDNNA